MEVLTYNLVDAVGAIGDWAPQDMEMIMKLTGVEGVTELISATESEIRKRQENAEEDQVQLLALQNGVAFLRNLISDPQ